MPEQFLIFNVKTNKMQERNYNMQTYTWFGFKASTEFLLCLDNKLYPQWKNTISGISPEEEEGTGNMCQIKAE